MSHRRRSILFHTRRLTVRRAVLKDSALFLKLWNDPGVMTFVGFPRGLGVQQEEIEKQLRNQPEGDFDRLLVAALRDSGEPVGECCLHPPDQRGIAGTDVKLLPVFQGRGYGTEIKRGLLDYLFTRTDCLAVEASPNVLNEASIRMQEKVGGRRVGEDVHHFPEGLEVPTVPVHHYIYRVFRENWLKLSSVLACPQREDEDSPDPEVSR